MQQDRPPVRFVDVDLTDNVPIPLPAPYRRLEGRQELVYAAPDGRVVLVPRRPVAAPSSWGLLS